MVGAHRTALRGEAHLAAVTQQALPLADLLMHWGIIGFGREF